MKLMFKTVPGELVRSRPADHSSEGIVSGDASGSVKKQGRDPVDKVRLWKRLPGVVLRPFTAEQSAEAIDGPVLRR